MKEQTGRVGVLPSIHTSATSNDHVSLPQMLGGLGSEPKEKTIPSGIISLTGVFYSWRCSVWCRQRCGTTHSLSLYQVDILNMESTVVCGYLNNEIFHYKHSSHPHRKKAS